MRLITVVLLVVAPVTVWEIAAPPRHAEPLTTIYDSNPAHLWNRLYAALLIREDHHGNRYGEDSLDPLLWYESKHLLSEPSHRQAMQVLDEFLRTHGESLVHDPVKRAMLQRDLWAVFDWSVVQASGNNQYDKEKRELQVRLAEVLRRLALTPDELKALPDNYAQAVASGSLAKDFAPSDAQRPFLPPDLFDPHGPWAGITPSPDYAGLGVAKMHIFNVSGRSSFLVFVKLPGGHKATMDYFRALWNFPQPWVQEANSDQATFNPSLPSFPAGTEVALVRRMNLFDSQGNLVTSNITESVQIRLYHAITTTPERFFSGSLADTIKNRDNTSTKSSSAARRYFPQRMAACEQSLVMKGSFPPFRQKVETRSKALSRRADRALSRKPLSSYSNASGAIPAEARTRSTAAKPCFVPIACRWSPRTPTTDRFTGATARQSSGSKIVTTGAC